MKINGFRAHSSDQTHAADSYSVTNGERIVTAKCGDRFYVTATRAAHFVTSASAPICRDCVRVIDEQQARKANAE